MKIALALLSLLVPYKEDVGHADLEQHRAQVAEAVWAASQGAPLPPRDWARLMLTVGFHESGLSMRIAAGNCRKHECDRGRAKGLWQLHANYFNRTEWFRQDGDIGLQAKLASDALKRAWGTCRGSGVEPVRATLSAYAGQGCGKEWKGLSARLATFQRLR